MRFYLALILLLCCPAAFPQTSQHTVSSSGTIAGAVMDPTGAVVPGAIIHVERHGATGPSIPNTLSDAVGNYTVAVPAGSYDVIVSAPGFEPSLKSVTVTRGSTAKLNATLVIATEEEQVNVSADSNSTSAAGNKSALVLGASELATMSDDDSTFQQQIQALAGGDPMQPSGVYVDGFSGGQIPPKESIREIRINQNPYSAQFQELGFGRIEIFTKPGSDKLHGNFGIFTTDSVLNSQNPFSGTQPPYYFFFARGNVSGPIGKKTSFFFNARYGNMGNNSVINAILPGSVPYNTVVPSPTLSNDINVRLDRQVTPNNVFTVRYEFAHTTLTNGGLTGSQSGNFNGSAAVAVSSQVLPSEAFNSTTNIGTLQLSDSQNIGKNKVLETRFQWIRNRTTQAPAVAATPGTPAYLNGGATPTYNVSGYFNGGGSPTQQIEDHTDNIEFQEYFSLEHGKHFFRLGGRYRGTRDANMTSAGYNGAYTYAPTPNTTITALQNFTNGIPSQYTVTIGQRSATIYTGDIGLYVDDEYSVRPNVTLNYGFRAESQSAIPDHFDPAPRVGASWALGKTDKRQPYLTLRAGFGLFYDRFSSTNILTAVRQQSGTLQPTYVFTLSGTTPTTCTATPTPSCTGGSVSVAQPTLYNISPQLRSEYKIVSGITAEKQFKFGKMSLNYLHNQGDHQWVSRNINAPLPGTYIYGQANSGVRPLGGTQNVYQFDSNGTSTANVVFGNAQLNPGKYVQLFLFTSERFQDSDTGGATSFPTNQYNLKADYGRVAAATFRIFTGTSFQLPYDFSLNTFFAMTSHNPFNITTGTDLNGDTQFNDRPSFATAASPATSVVDTPLGSFNTTPVAGETIVPINYGNGPRFVYTELGLNKAFHFGPVLPAPPAPPGPQKSTPAKKPLPPQKMFNLSFFLEVDNVLNHPNPGQPVGQVTSPEFDKSLSLNSTFIGSPNANRMIYFGTFFNF